MDPSTSPLREQGMQALREGNLDQAIDVLSRAVMLNDADAEAKALLGVAYSQKGLHQQAKRALQTAVELHPGNANFRFNLGVALERAGDQQGAAIAYRDTLQINRDHGQARAKLQAMGPAAHALLANAPKPPDAGGVTPSGPPPAPYTGPPGGGASPPGYGGPPGGSAPPPPMSAPLGGPPQGLPGLGGGLAGPQGPPGTVQCGRCGQWTKPGSSCEWCSAGLGGARTQPVGPAPAGAPVYSRVQAEDEFNLVEAARAWGATIVAPRSFFAEQAQYAGMKGPMAFLLLYSLVSMVTSLISQAVSSGGRGGGAYLGGLVFGGVCGIVCLFITLLVSMFTWAGMLHLAARMFKGQGEYAGSFRVAVYAAAPSCLLGVLMNLAMPFLIPESLRTPSRRARPAPSAAAMDRAPRLLLAQAGGPSFPRAPGGLPQSPGGLPGGGSPAMPAEFAKLLNALVPLFIISTIGWLWTFVLTVIGLSEVHQIGIGASFGAVIVANLIVWLIVGILAFLFGAALAAVIAGAMSAAGRGGG